MPSFINQAIRDGLKASRAMNAAYAFQTAELVGICPASTHLADG